MFSSLKWLEDIQIGVSGDPTMSSYNYDLCLSIYLFSLAMFCLKTYQFISYLWPSSLYCQLKGAGLSAQRPSTRATECPAPECPAPECPAPECPWQPSAQRSSSTQRPNINQRPPPQTLFVLFLFLLIWFCFLLRRVLYINRLKIILNIKEYNLSSSRRGFSLPLSFYWHVWNKLLHYLSVLPLHTMPRYMSGR
jgi:hypothetical protein